VTSRPARYPLDPPIALPGADAVLAEMVGDAVQPTLVIAPDGRVRQANARAAEALGHDDADVLAGAPAPLTLDGAPTGFRVTELALFCARDGAPVRVTSVAAPLELPDGPGVVVAFTDVVESDDDALHRAAPPRIASLRRVVTEIVGGMAEMRTYASLAREAARAAALPLLHIVRVEPGGAEVGVVGGWSQVPCKLGAGVRYPAGDVPGAAELLATPRRTLVDDLAVAPGRAAELLRDEGIFALAWEPVVVDGEVWGALLAGRTDATAQPDEPAVLAALADLLATRASEAADRAELARLLDKQAALRRVATLVAANAGLDELLAVVTREIGLLLDLDLLHLARYDEGGLATGVASWSLRGNPIPLGGVSADDGESIPSVVLRTGRAVRMSNYSAVAEPVAERVRALEIRTAVGVPLFIDGRLWGVLGAAATDDRRLPDDIGERIAEFAELVATAISNTETRAARARLAEEQAALRHVATLVARGAETDRVFAEVGESVARLLHADTATVASFHDLEAVRPGGLADRIRATGQPAHDRAAAAVPIVVGGERWGALIVQGRPDCDLPEDTTDRLASFAELIATAIANRQARAEARDLADEQAALRRVATLVAQAAPPEQIVATVAEELGRLMDAAGTEIVRYEDDPTATVIAGWGGTIMEVGAPISSEGHTVVALVRRTGRPARITRDELSGPHGEQARARGVQFAVGAPILVDGRVWGAASLVTREARPFPPETEHRISRFTELVAAAIANIQARADLAASRARVIAAADEGRQRVVRDLHDGAQQRLVHTIVTLKMALARLGDVAPEVRALVADGVAQAERATEELRALSRGILPEVLLHDGLPGGVAALAEIAPVPVEVDVEVGRLPRAVEATAYFVVAEALTNVAKHASASGASVRVGVRDGVLEVAVRDDGGGGARADGKGLLGLADRLAVFDGRLAIDSPPGRGTLVAAELPLPLDDDHGPANGGTAS
jgi:signal transduction histidine kinase